MNYNDLATAGFTSLDYPSIALRGHDLTDQLIPYIIELIDYIGPIRIIDLESDVNLIIELIDYIGPVRIIELEPNS